MSSEQSSALAVTIGVSVSRLTIQEILRDCPVSKIPRNLPPHHRRLQWGKNLTHSQWKQVIFSNELCLQTKNSWYKGMWREPGTCFYPQFMQEMNNHGGSGVMI